MSSLKNALIAYKKKKAAADNEASAMAAMVFDADTGPSHKKRSMTKSKVRNIKKIILCLNNVTLYFRKRIILLGPPPPVEPPPMPPPHTNFHPKLTPQPIPTPHPPTIPQMNTRGMR